MITQGKIVFSTIFYIVVTCILLFILINEKKIVEKINKYKLSLSNVIKDKLGEKISPNILYLLRGVHILGIIIFVMVFRESVLTNRLTLLILLFNIIGLVIGKYYTYLFIANIAGILLIKMTYPYLSNSVIVLLIINAALTLIYVLSKNEEIESTINYSEVLISSIIIVLIIHKFYLGNFMVPTGSMVPTIKPGHRLFGDMISYNFRDPKREEVIVFKEPVNEKVLYTKRLIGLPGERLSISNTNTVYVDGKRLERQGYLVEHPNDFNGKIEGRGYINFEGIEKSGYNFYTVIGEDEWYIPKKGDKVKIELLNKEGISKYMENNDISNPEKIQNEMFSKLNTDSEETLGSKFVFYVNGEKTGMLFDLINEKEVFNNLLEVGKYEIELSEDYYLVLGDNTKYSLDSRFWGFVPRGNIKGKALLTFWPLNAIGLIK